MAKTMGIYCKAYLLEQFRAFADWNEDASAARPPEDGGDSPRVLDGGDVVYLHDNLVVTDGIFRDEHVLYCEASEAWELFCKEELKFAVPEDVLRANDMATA